MFNFLYQGGNTNFDLEFIYDKKYRNVLVDDLSGLNYQFRKKTNSYVIAANIINHIRVKTTTDLIESFQHFTVDR